jgi:quercetin dioxygenase-like cupin family protein
MARFALSLAEVPLQPGAAPRSLRAANAMLYVVAGGIDCGGAAVATNAALHVAGEVRLRASGDGACCLCFSLDAEATMADAKLSVAIELEPAAPYLMRCDRVDFPPGGIAFLHTHQGPGIRCLLKGHLSVESEGRVQEIEPGGAWFESGPEPVLARASASQETAFVRVMLLPLALLGKSSIRYVRAEDRERPKPQRYTVFQDVPIGL